MSQSNKPPQGGSGSKPAPTKAVPFSKKPTPSARSSGSKSVSPSGSTSKPPGAFLPVPAAGSSGSKPPKSAPTLGAASNASPKPSQTPTNPPASVAATGSATSKTSTNSDLPQPIAKCDPSNDITSKGGTKESIALKSIDTPPASTEASVPAASATATPLPSSGKSSSSSAIHTPSDNFSGKFLDEIILTPDLPPFGLSQNRSSAFARSQSSSSSRVTSNPYPSQGTGSSPFTGGPIAYSANCDHCQHTAGRDAGGPSLGPFAFMQTTRPINWAQHPLSFQFASLLRSYLNRTGYEDGLPKIQRSNMDQSYGANTSRTGSRPYYPMGSNSSRGRWNSLYSQSRAPTIPFRPQPQQQPTEEIQIGAGVSDSVPAQISGFLGPPSSAPHASSQSPDTVPPDGGSSGSKAATSAPSATESTSEAPSGAL